MLNKIGERTLPWGKPFFSVFSICYAHCLVPHRILCWTTYSGELYIGDCPVLCGRVLLGAWIGGFLGDRDNGNVAPCTLLIE